MPTNANAELWNGLQHLIAVRDLCKDYNDSIGPRSSEFSEIWSASLSLRSVVALDAVIALIQLGLNDDAAVIIRTMFEIELQLGTIKEEPEFATLLGQRTEAFRSGRLKAFIKAITEGREMPEGVTKEALIEQREEIRAAIKNWVTKRRSLRLKKLVLRRSHRRGARLLSLAPGVRAILQITQ